MMDIAQEIERLQQAKENIKASIENKGVKVNQEVTIDMYPSLIDKIEVNKETTDALWHMRTNSGTDCSYLFYHCKASTLDLSGFKSNNVTATYNMFQGSNATTIDLTGFSTSKANAVHNMFDDCKVTTIHGEIDLSSAIDISNMFNDCNKLTSAKITNIFANVEVTNENKFALNLGSTKITDICLIQIMDQLPDLITDKGLAERDKLIFTLPAVNTLSEEQVQVAIDKGWTVVNTTY